MSNSLFEFGREGFLDGSLDWDTQNFKAALLDLNTAEVGVRQIASSTTGPPMVITTAVTHGYTNGDIVYIADHATNTSANGVWAITAASGTVFSLTDPVTGANATGNGTGAATGYAVNLGRNTVGTRFWDAFDGGLVGALSGNLATKTVVNGVADADDVTFTAVSGASVEAVAIIQDTGTPSTSRMAVLITGKQIVTVNTALAAGTALLVEPIKYGIPNSTVIPFSSGQSATLTALANAGDRVLTVTSTTIAIGARGQAPATGSGLPVTPNGGNIVVTFDSGPNKIFKL
jgi:hypothetical protein